MVRSILNQIAHKIKKLSEVDKTYRIVNRFSKKHIESELKLALFLKTENSTRQIHDTVHTPFGMFPVQVSVPHLDFSGGYEVPINAASALRINYILIESLNKQRKELEEDITNLMSKLTEEDIQSLDILEAPILSVKNLMSK